MNISLVRLAETEARGGGLISLTCSLPCLLLDFIFLPAIGCEPILFCHVKMRGCSQIVWRTSESLIREHRSCLTLYTTAQHIVQARETDVLYRDNVESRNLHSQEARRKSCSFPKPFTWVAVVLTPNTSSLSDTSSPEPKAWKVRYNDTVERKPNITLIWLRWRVHIISDDHSSRFLVFSPHRQLF